MSGRQSLEDWKNASRTSISDSRDPLTRRLLDARENGEFVKITYDGGSSPGAAREIQPRHLFRVSGYGDAVYMEAFCSFRNEVRVFKLDRISMDDLSAKEISKTRPASKQREKTKFPRAPTPVKRAVIRDKGRPSSSPWAPKEIKRADRSSRGLGFGPTPKSSGQIWWIWIVLLVLVFWWLF